MTPKTLKMVLAAFSSGARNKRIKLESYTHYQWTSPPAEAFIVFTDLRPRATETEVGAALCAIGAGGTLTFLFLTNSNITLVFLNSNITSVRYIDTIIFVLCT